MALSLKHLITSYTFVRELNVICWKQSGLPDLDYYILCMVDNVVLWLHLENNWPWLFPNHLFEYEISWTSSPHYQPISTSEPFTLPAGEYAVSQSDFDDKWGWFIQLLCPDDKMGAT